MPLQFLIPPKILLVDDDALTVSALKIELKSAGFSVFLTEKPDEVLELLAKHKIDLVFVDLMMPNRLGFKVLKMIKDEKTTRHLPVIILTNLSHMDYIDAGLDIGAADYLLKSQVSSSEVVKVAKKYLMTFSARQNLHMS